MGRQRHFGVGFEVRSILVYYKFSQYEVSITVSTCHPGNQAEKWDKFFTSLNPIYTLDKNCEYP